MTVLLATVDLLLALGLTLRLTRLVTSDTISLWWLRGPLFAWAAKRDLHDDALQTDSDGWSAGPRMRAVSGLYCPFCVGFWISAVVLISLALVGGPAEAADWWRWIAALFTLNYISGHISARLDSTEDDDE